MPPRHHYSAITAAVSAVVLIVSGNSNASAAPVEPSVQEQIDAHLAAYPSGKQTSPTEITYGNGRFVITFVKPANSTNVTPDCPADKFCFYDRVNFGFPRGKLADCGWQDLAQWGWQNLTESVYYNQNYGSVTFIAHGSRYDHGADYGLFNISTSYRAIADVYPYRNMADHVYRYC